MNADIPPTPTGSPLIDALGLASTRAMPIASYPGAQCIGASTRDLVTSAAAQTGAILALHDRLRLPALLACMDLSVEAEAFGAHVHHAEDEVPSIEGRLVQSAADAASLPIPAIGTARTGLQPEVVRALARSRPTLPIVGGATGPFSLAARLLGTSEALVLTLQEPDRVRAVLDRVVPFLRNWLMALRDAGACAVIVAEPTAGLLSPAGMATFSSAPLKQVAEGIDGPGFRVILHNCAARAVHLPSISATGLSAFHFGTPMNLAAALDHLPREALVFGNLDPTSVFTTGTPESVAESVRTLVGQHGRDSRWVPSSGCDLPRRTPLENMRAFVEAIQNSGPGRGPLAAAPIA